MTEVVEYQQELRHVRLLAQSNDGQLEEALEHLRTLWARVPADERFGLPTPLRALPV